MLSRTKRFDADAVDRWIATLGAQAVLERLRPYVTPTRQARIDTVVAGRLAGIHVAIEAPCDPHNAAAVVRTAEALGALGVHVIAAEGRALHAKRTTQGAFHWVKTEHHGSLDEFRSSPALRGRRLYGAWMGATTPLHELPVDTPLCILLGNENRGLSVAARACCDVGFHIPMFGMSESLNLSVSAAIALYELTRRRRALMGNNDLSPEDENRLRARYYIGSVEPRLAAGLLEG